MEISLRTASHALQALLIEFNDLQKDLNETHEDDAEGYLLLEHIEDALDELAMVYTEYIEKNKILNYPSYERLKKALL